MAQITVSALGFSLDATNDPPHAFSRALLVPLIVELRNIIDNFS